MGRIYARTMFHEAAKRYQETFGSRASYERLAQQGQMDNALGEAEIEFIGLRDSFYMTSITDEGWPYVQHRGGPGGFLKVIDPESLAFADLSGNKQYISAGNMATNDRVALFLMDYPNQARLKILGHAQVVGAGVDAALEAAVSLPGYPARLERVIRIGVVAFDWNCSQHITPRYSPEEIERLLGAGEENRVDGHARG